MSQKFPTQFLHRSRGLKLIVVCFLVLLMAIPAMFISYIAFDRSNRADDVVREVSNTYGGPQTLTGPMLSVPYVGYDQDGRIDRRGDYIIFADAGVASFENIGTETRKRSLFRVPIFTADGKLNATFNDPKATQIDPGYELDWDRARLLIALSDVRGLKQDIDLSIEGSAVSRRFEPANSNNLPRLSSNYEYAKTVHSFGVSDLGGSHSYLAVSAADLIVEGQSLSVDVEMKLGGAKTFGVRPFARSTQVSLSSAWIAPGFVGDLPPDDRDINDDGFSAQWNVPYLRRGIRGHGSTQILSELMSSRNMMGVNFVAKSNPYQTVNRALKYSVMFIGLVFLAYFLLEVIVGVPVHPAQYLLIGLAQAIFYLLLLAFSEHIGFVGAFIVSAGATIMATAGYAGAVFGHRKYILRTGVAFGIVYGLLFVLMRLQDFALMIGALTSFIAIAGTMFLTRNMNWYGEKAEISVKSD
jgi:inner membrane protein